MADDNLSVTEEAVQFLRTCNNENTENFAMAMEAFRFRDGDQWPVDIANSRRLDTRPCLTINKLDTYCRHIENNQRQQRPRAKVVPTDSLGSKDVAKIFQGMIRHIEQSRCGVDLALDTAFSHAITAGFGYYRLLADYENPTSFQQEIFYEWVPNPFMVKFDPSSTAPDGSDAKACLIGTLIDKKVFKKQYPNADTSGWLERWLGATSEWETKDQIFVAEYYKIVQTEATLVKLSNGQTYWKDKIKMEAVAARGLMIVDERKSMRNKVMWYKLTHKDILESRELPGYHIPVFPIYGNISIIDGKRRFSGIVKNAKDPQMMINYHESTATESVSMSPKAKYLLAAGQDEGFEDEWLSANVSPRPGLHYNLKDEMGNDLPPPIVVPPPQPPAGILTMLQNADSNLRAVIGIMNPEERLRGNVSQGALTQEQSTTENATYHFYDNLTRTLRHSSRVIVDWIPYYYPEEAVVRIVGPDDMSDTITVNQMTAIGEIENNITIGCYDIVMETGPGYASKRQEAVANMMPLFEKDPELRKIAGDILFRNMDFPGADAIADRLAALNPQAQQQTIAKLPKEAQALVAGLQQQLQQATQHIQALMMDQKYRMSVEKMKQEGATRRELMAHHAEIERETIEDKAWEFDMRKKSETAIRTAMINAHTKVHDTEERAKTAIQVAKIKQGEDMEAVVEHDHPVHGHVTEADIQHTAKVHGLTRKQVIEKMYHHQKIHEEMEAQRAERPV